MTQILVVHEAVKSCQARVLIKRLDFDFIVFKTAGRFSFLVNLFIIKLGIIIHSKHINSEYLNNNQINK